MTHLENFADPRPWSRAEFQRRLLDKGRLYHTHHPFHLALNSGRCTREQVQAWVANRFYYQSIIPVKDAAILANCPDRAIRRLWIRRLLDQDGHGDDPGGLEAWLHLAEAVGLEREEVQSCRQVLPGVRFACDAYVSFARQASWQEGVCASLTELFAPALHQQRLEHWPLHYPWIETQGYEYFRRRLREAGADARQGLALTLEHCVTRAQQERALAILQMKLDVLWCMLDALQLAYVHDEPPYHSCRT